MGIAREVTRGTIVVPSIWVPKVNYNVEDKALKAVFEGGYGSIDAMGDDALVAQKWAEGDLELDVGDNSIALLLYALFGSLSSAAFNSVLKHTLTVQNSVQPTTLSLLMNDPIATDDENISIAYAMAMVNSMELNVELGELVRVIFNFIAKNHTDFTEQSSSYSAENKFSHKHVTFKVAADTTGLDAASKINIQSLSLRIERDVIRENALGTVQPVDILSRKFRITGRVRLTYEDRTYRDYLLNGTKKAIRIDIVNSDVTIGTTNPAIRFDLPIVHFDSWDPSSPLEDIAVQEITFEALYDVTNSQLVSDVYVVNETASY